MKNYLLFLVFLSINLASVTAQEVDLDQKVSSTDYELLPYDISKIIVRGFDGSNPPPTMIETNKTLLYGYGMTAYHISSDSLIFFRILSLDAVHRDADGNEINRFPIRGSRYTQDFKNYFLNKIPKDQRKYIWFENIYIKDKKENYLKLAEPQRFCPHCL